MAVGRVYYLFIALFGPSMRKDKMKNYSVRATTFLEWKNHVSKPDAMINGRRCVSNAQMPKFISNVTLTLSLGKLDKHIF